MSSLKSPVSFFNGNFYCPTYSGNIFIIGTEPDSEKQNFRLEEKFVTGIEEKRYFSTIRKEVFRDRLFKCVNEYDDDENRWSSIEITQGQNQFVVKIEEAWIKTKPKEVTIY